MTTRLSSRLSRRAEKSGLRPTPAALAQLDAYLSLLAKWNRKINLTAFDLDKPTDAAIDRLIIEPLVAARYVARSDLLAIDIGSGGGSPAIPFAIAAPHLRMVLVEVKTRKAAFLRAAARELALDRLQVENRRAEELLTDVEMNEAADLVLLRAVRADAPLWATIGGLLRPGGRMFWFTAAGTGAGSIAGPLEVTERHALDAGKTSELVLLVRPDDPM